MVKLFLRRLPIAVLLAFLVLTVAACGGTATPTAVPPTATPVPPTATPIPPTPTAIPPTATTAPAAAATSAPAGAAPTKPAAAATAVSAATPTMGVAASSADRDLVSAAFANLAKATSFGMTVTISGGSAAAAGAGDIVMEVVQSPTRSVHMVVGDQLEMIVIGQDAYMKSGATTWQTSTMAADQLAQLESSLDFTNALNPLDVSKVQISRLGSEKIGSVDTDVFNITVMDAQTQTTKMWISKADKTVVQQSVEEQDTSVRVSFYGWNKLKIVAPKM